MNSVIVAGLLAAISAPPGTQRDVTAQVAISAAATTGTVSFTNAIDTEGFNQLSLSISVARNSSTAIAMSCYNIKPSAPSTSYTIQACDGSTWPTLTCSDAVWSKTYSGNVSFVWNIPINYQKMSCTFTVTSGGANDKITVGQAMLGVL